MDSACTLQAHVCKAHGSRALITFSLVTAPGPTCSKPRERGDGSAYLGGGVVVSGRSHGLGVTPVTQFSQSKTPKNLTWKQTHCQAGPALLVLLEGPRPALPLRTKNPLTTMTDPSRLLLSNRLATSPRPSALPAATGQRGGQCCSWAARRDGRLSLGKKKPSPPRAAVSRPCCQEQHSYLVRSPRAPVCEARSTRPGSHQSQGSRSEALGSQVPTNPNLPPY